MSAWNARHVVGRAVRYWPGTRDEEGLLGFTSAPAQDLNGVPVVCIEGAGAIALTHVQPISDEKRRAIRRAKIAARVEARRNAASEPEQDEPEQDEPEQDEPDEPERPEVDDALCFEHGIDVMSVEPAWNHVHDKHARLLHVAEDDGRHWDADVPWLEREERLAGMRDGLFEYVQGLFNRPRDSCAAEAMARGCYERLHPDRAWQELPWTERDARTRALGGAL